MKQILGNTRDVLPPTGDRHNHLRVPASEGTALAPLPLQERWLPFGHVF